MRAFGARRRVGGPTSPELSASPGERRRGISSYLAQHGIVRLSCVTGATGPPEAPATPAGAPTRL